MANEKLTSDAVLAELQPMFEEILDEPGLVINRASNTRNTPNWDSLAHIEIIESIERHYKVKFSLSELEKLKEVGDLIDLVIAKSA